MASYHVSLLYPACVVTLTISVLSSHTFTGEFSCLLVCLDSDLQYIIYSELFSGPAQVGPVGQSCHTRRFDLVQHILFMLFTFF